MFASRVKKTLEFPDEDGTMVPVVVRKLSHRSMEKAADIQQGTQVAKARELGADLLRAFRESAQQTETAKTARASATVRYRAFDRDQILTAGIESIGGSSATEVLRKSILDLDEETAEKIHRAICDLSLPTPEAAEEEAGKD